MAVDDVAAAAADDDDDDDNDDDDDDDVDVDDDDGSGHGHGGYDGDDNDCPSAAGAGDLASRRLEGWRNADKSSSRFPSILRLPLRHTLRPSFSSSPFSSPPLQTRNSISLLVLVFDPHFVLSSSPLTPSSVSSSPPPPDHCPLLFLSPLSPLIACYPGRILDLNLLFFKSQLLLISVVYYTTQLWRKANEVLFGRKVTCPSFPASRSPPSDPTTLHILPSLLLTLLLPLPSCCLLLLSQLPALNGCPGNCFPHDFLPLPLLIASRSEGSKTSWRRVWLRLSRPSLASSSISTMASTSASARTVAQWDFGLQ
eukprot:764720-Hanusia_phi.AAC.2